MSREWKPGDVARLGHVDGVSLVVDGCMKHLARGPHWHHDDDGWDHLNVSHARPLVVIDPEDREAVERLADAFDTSLRAADPDYYERAELYAAEGDDLDVMQAALREFANPKPPRPEEPTGLGAVVEDASSDLYVRTSQFAKRPWCRAGTDNHLGWVEMDDEPLKVLDEGVQP